MKETLLVVAYASIRAYIGGGLFDRMADLVQDLSSATMPGKEKKKQVANFLVAESVKLTDIFLDLVIAIVRARFERVAPR